MSESVEAGLSAPEVAQPEATQENVATPKEETPTPEEVKPEADEKKFTQAELDEIIRARIAKAEAKAERRVLKALERIVPQPAPKQEAAPTEYDRPKRDQFASDEDWVEAVADWKLDKRDQAANQQRFQQQAKSLTDKTESFYAEAAKTEGFDREEFDSLPLTPHIAQALIESDAPAKLMVYMAAHPEEVEKIAALNPVRQIKELDRLEAKIASAPKTSNAPPPIKPIGTRGSANNSDPTKLGMDEYIAQRKAQGARWAR